MLSTETVASLVQTALEARENSYSPYSGFAVGAALLTAEGKVYTGANIESASYTPTICAERVAMFSAVHAGQRRFSAIAVVGGPAGQPVSAYCAPCGVCRQVLTEFCPPDFAVILFDGSTPKLLTLGDLLPESFTQSNLSK